MTESFDRAAIKARAEAATEGAWGFDIDPFREGVTYTVFSGSNVFSGEVAREAIEEDAEFIAHAREDIPALLAALEEAETLLDARTYQRDLYRGQIVELTERAEDAERRIAAVEALHRPRTIQVLTGKCAAEECDHEEIEDCPLTPFEQCVECDRIADEVSSYYSESGVGVSAWPCPTVAALHPVAEITESENNDE